MIIFFYLILVINLIVDLILFSLLITQIYYLLKNYKHFYKIKITMENSNLLLKINKKIKKIDCFYSLLIFKKQKEMIEQSIK